MIFSTKWNLGKERSVMQFKFKGIAVSTLLDFCTLLLLTMTCIKLIPITEGVISPSGYHVPNKLYNLHASGGYEKSKNTQTQAIKAGRKVPVRVVQSSLLDMNLVVDSAEGPTPPSSSFLPPPPPPLLIFFPSHTLNSLQADPHCLFPSTNSSMGYS